LIQRIQTVYLALAVIIDLIIFFTPIYRHAVNDPADWIGIGFAAFLTIAMILALISIFLYGNRTNQIKWVKASSYFQIAALGVSVAILFTLGGFGRFLLEELLSTGGLFISLILLWMAGRQIKKDQELVDSMDRIR
jgi:divalent metal cation (Fe/Co/Zn/Cd) transporter